MSEVRPANQRVSTLRPELVLIRQGFRDRIARGKRIVARATAWPLAVRLCVLAAALAAQAFAFPGELLAGSFGLLVVFLAALPALWPRTAAVSIYWLLIVVGWLAATTLYDGVASLSRLIGLTVSLYVVHSGAALAAVLPYDAVVDPDVVARWLLRAAVVVGVCVGAVMAALLWIDRIRPVTHVAASVIGLAVTVLLAWLLAVGARARSR